MGGLCSRNLIVDEVPSHVNDGGHVHHYGSVVGTFQGSSSKKTQSNLTPVPLMGNMDKNLQEPKQSVEPILVHDIGIARYGSNQDEFYDGIPRYTGDLSSKSRSVKPKHAAVAKVSDVGSRLSRVGTVGLGKAVEVLDTLGSSMTNLNATSGFASGIVAKGSELTILAFEVANTIVKGSNLMKSLSKRSIKHLKEDVLPSEGVQHLVSENMDELLSIVADDKREELKLFSGEVVRFGNRCKHSHWHNLDRYFEKIARELTPQKQLKEEAESVMEELMTLVQYSAELYHELHALDKFEFDYQRRHQEEHNSIGSQKGDNLVIFRAELKGQRKQVRNLKKKSLWSRSMEEVMEKLVVIVHFLHLEIHNSFGSADSDESVKGYLNNHLRLGPAGLALHYANIVIQIDNLVARPSSMPSSTRDTLYQSLPPNIKSALRSKLQPFCVKEELTVTEIKDEMEKTLHWLVPIATNTAKAHHGFGWVGEWANTGSEMNRKPSGQADVSRIETLHHASKEKTETYILDLVLWLHQLIGKFTANTNGGGFKSPTKFPIQSLVQTNLHSKHDATSALPVVLTTEDQEMLLDVKRKKGPPGISKSLDLDCNTRLRKHDRLSKSCSNSPTRESKDMERLSSGISDQFWSQPEKKHLDVIDRVDSPLQQT